MARGERATYFSHHFETRIARHPGGASHHIVVDLDASLQSELPFDERRRLRMEADVSGVPVEGAWQLAA